MSTTEDLEFRVFGADDFNKEIVFGPDTDVDFDFDFDSDFNSDFDFNKDTDLKLWAMRAKRQHLRYSEGRAHCASDMDKANG